ncbi:hypothetical protein [Bremerella cremea]|uniref:hypothetical protein n=1 Tax=Bremerella cremea TaxID=1031537 RepID=UPI0031F1337A
MVRFVCTLMAFSLITTTSTPSWAASPVQFDVGYLTAARDVTSPEFKHARPGYRLLQMDVLISTMVDSRISEDLVETTFFIEPHNPRIQIEDFSPQTTLQSPYAGNISTENRTELELNGKVSAKDAITPTLGGDASVGVTRKHSSVEKVDVLPELKLVAASGTIHRGRGVFFRFNRSKQTSLEGTTALGIVVAVPENWSADTMTVRCRAKIRQPVVPGGPTKEVDLPEIRYTVATYQSGDRYASQVADRYIQEEARWQSIQREYADEIRNRRHDSPLDYLTSIVRPDRASGSIAERMQRSPEKASRELPSAVVDAYYRYQEAKSLLDSCNGLRPLVRAQVTDETAVANSSVSIDTQEK